MPNLLARITISPEQCVVSVATPAGIFVSRAATWILICLLGVPGFACQDSEVPSRAQGAQEPTRPIRGNKWSKSFTVLVFAGTGDQQGRLYVWRNSNLSGPSAVDGWYDSIQSLAEALTEGELREFEVYAGGHDGLCVQDDIRPLSKAETLLLQETIQPQRTAW